MPRYIVEIPVLKLIYEKGDPYAEPGCHHTVERIDVGTRELSSRELSELISEALEKKFFTDVPGYEIVRINPDSEDIKVEKITDTGPILSAVPPAFGRTVRD